MATTRPNATSSRIVFFSVILLAASGTARVAGQVVGRQPLNFKVSTPGERLEMIVNTSRIIGCEHRIPQLMIDNESIVKARPISTNEIQLSALKPGFTTLTIIDEHQKEHAI